MQQPATAADTSGSLDNLPTIIRKIPRSCFQRPVLRAWFYLARDYLMVAATVYSLWLVYARFHTQSGLTAGGWILGLPLALFLGMLFTGLFVIGHDAGHRSFGKSPKVNNFVGHLTLSPLLWPFHVWRLSHDHHHRWTHHAVHEIAWRPLTLAEYDELSPMKQRIYRLIRSSSFGLAAILFQYFFIKDAVTGAFFERKDAAELRYSLLLTAAVATIYIVSIGAFLGLYGLVYLFLVPQLVFQFWMSLFTLLHHTSPHNELLADSDWSPEKAQLSMSVYVRYPRLLDWVTHDISCHVPHHVCVGIPHYHLRAAHAALKQAYPSVVQEQTFSWPYLRTVLTNCHLIEGQTSGHLGWYATGSSGQLRAAKTL